MNKKIIFLIFVICFVCLCSFAYFEMVGSDSISSVFKIKEAKEDTMDEEENNDEQVDEQIVVDDGDALVDKVFSNALNAVDNASFTDTIVNGYPLLEDNNGGSMEFTLYGYQDDEYHKTAHVDGLVSYYIYYDGHFIYQAYQSEEIYIDDTMIGSFLVQRGFFQSNDAVYFFTENDDVISLMKINLDNMNVTCVWSVSIEGKSLGFSIACDNKRLVFMITSEYTSEDDYQLCILENDHVICEEITFSSNFSSMAMVEDTLLIWAGGNYYLYDLNTYVFIDEDVKNVQLKTYGYSAIINNKMFLIRNDILYCAAFDQGVSIEKLDVVLPNLTISKIYAIDEHQLFLICNNEGEYIAYNLAVFIL